MTSAKRGHADCVKLLLTVGALDLRDVNGDSALHFAAGRGHMPVVAVLLDRGSDHHARNNSDDRAIDVAMHRRHTQVRPAAVLGGAAAGGGGRMIVAQCRRTRARLRGCVAPAVNQRTLPPSHGACVRACVRGCVALP
jgi:hypothetical protein